MTTEKPLTLGSLFDGSGGFPLGGLLAGITPVWASEIEPFPIRVTTKRLPFMKHYGNISAMDGGKIEPVDIITFGSPCQDMSIAGRRDGLDGSRSSLFYEAVRIIKEMRCATDGRYPRYIVWENVPGAFSSNKGEDFKAVLEAVIGIAEPNAEVPMPEKARWPYADIYLGDGWSVAYRTLDAQYWGVPQRRRRIYLVADLAGGGAGKILFESEGLSGYSAEGFHSWQRAAGSFTPCAGATGYDGYNGSLTDDTSATLGVNCGMSTGRNGIVLNDQGGNRMDITEEVTSTLRAEAHHPPCVMESAGFCTEHSAKSRTIGYEEECFPTLRAGVIPAAVYENHSQDTRYTFNQGQNAKFAPTFEEELQPTLVAKGPGAIQSGYTVRRLTPTECARLQGFPDNWCADLGTEKPSDEEMYFWHKVFKTYSEVTGCKMKSDKQVAKWLKDPYSDSAEYKMWGNGVALPCVWFVLCGIVWYAQSGNDNTPT